MERALLVRQSVMAPSRIVALARARSAGRLVTGAACGASSVASWVGRTAWASHDKTTALTYAWSNIAIILVSSVERTRSSSVTVIAIIKQRKITGPPGPRAWTKKHTK